MEILKFCVAFVLLCSVAQCQTDGCLAEEGCGSPDPAVFANAVNSFSFRLLEEARRTEGSGNLIFSPLSLSAAFSLLHLGAEGATKDEMNEVFGFEGEEIPQLIREESLKAESSNDGNTGLVSIVYHDETVVLTEEYEELVGEDSVQSVDFRTSSRRARREINGLISDKTMGLIEEGLPEGSIDSSTLLVLVNVLFFQGVWKNPFDKEDTKRMVFKGVEGEQEVDFMGYDENIDVAIVQVPELDSEAIELPYDDGRFSMIIFLPDTPDGWVKAEENLHRININSVLNGTEVKTLSSIRIPKFDLEGSLPNLAANLESLGLESLFAGADLSGISDTPLSLTSAIHSVRVKIDEEGTTAAAVSSGIFQKSLLDRTFTAAHPFLFLIVDKPNAVIWFQGTVTNVLPKV